MPAMIGIYGFPDHWYCFKKNSKKNKMRECSGLLLALVIATAPLLIIPACSKSSDSSSDLVGNWAIDAYFDGNARSEAVSFTINDTVFVGTGMTSSKRLSDFYKFSLDKRYWTKINDFGGGVRSQAVGFAVNGKGYVGTGLDVDQNYTNDILGIQSCNQWLD